MKAPMQDMQKYFKEKKWEEISFFYTPVEIVKELGFKNAMIVAHGLLYRWDSSLNQYNVELQEYAVTLLYVLKGMHPNEWGTCWKYEAFLGSACDIIMDYEGRYEAYRRAYEKASSPIPPKLLIELAGCCICPGPPPISYDKAIELLEKAIETSPYLDALNLLSAVYAHKDEAEKRIYWSRLYDKLEKEGGERAPSIEPSFLKISS